MPNANWSNPTLTSTYTNFVSEVKNRDEDLALQFDGTTSTNIPTNAIRWDSSAGRWKKWNGSAWAELAATYALTNITATGTLSTGDSIQAGTNGGNVGIYVGQTGYSGALLYIADGSVQLSARSGYGLRFSPAPQSATNWGQFSSGGFFGLGIAPTTKLHVVGTEVTDPNLSAIVGPAFSSNTTNNADTTALQTAFTIGRDGKSGVSYANQVNFNIGRYSQSGTASQTQLTLRLSNGNQNNPEVDVLTLLGNGNAGFGTTSPQTTLHAYGGGGELIRVESNYASDGYILFKNTSGSMSAGMSGAASNTFLIFDRVNTHSAYAYAGGASGNHVWYINNAEQLRLTSSGLGLNTTTPRGNLSIANNTTGATVSTSLHLGYSAADFYGFRLVNTNNPSNTAAGAFALQRGTVSGWADVLTVDDNGLLTAFNGISGAVTRATAVAVSGSSSVSWGSIPSWVKRISIHFSGVSLNGTDHLLVRLSTGGTFAASGYTSSSNYTGAGSATGGVSSTAGFALFAGDAANVLTGTYTFTNITGDTWVGTGGHIYDNDGQFVGHEAGKVTLGGTLDGIRLLPTGFNAFDSGTVNITMEG